MTGCVPSGQALVASDEARSDLHPSGFDPSRFVWRTQTAKYSAGKDLLIGDIALGSAFYDGVSSRAVPERYKIETKLPGFRPQQDRFATEEEAKAALERLTIAWFARMVPASAMSAGTAETQSGSGLRPASAVPKADAQ